MANYDSFREKQDRRDEDWFLRATTKAAIISGLAIGGYSLKGPAARLVRKAKENVFDKIFRQVSKRYIKEPPSINETPYTLKSEVISRPKTDSSLVSEQLKEGASVSKIFPHLRNEINSIESRLVDFTINQDIDLTVDMLKKGIPTSATNQVLGPEISKGGKINFENNLQNDLLATLRRDLLLDYFSQVGARQDREVLDIMELKIRGSLSKDEVKKVTQLHEEYIDDPLYAQKYRKELGRLFTKFRDELRKMRSFGRSRGVRLSPEDAKRIITHGYKIASPEELTDQYVLSGSKNFSERWSFKASENKVHTDLLNNLLNVRPTGEKLYTANNLGGTPTDWFNNNKLLKNISAFDYTPELRNLAKKLMELKGDAQYTGVSDVRFNLITENARDRIRYYALVELQHNDSKRWYNFARIPLSQNGLFPGGTPGTKDLIDGFYVTKYGQTFRDIAEVKNKSQLIINFVSNRVSGRLVSGEFKSNPQQAVTRMKHELRFQEADMPRYTGQVRDIAKAMRLVDPLMDTIHVKGKHGKSEAQFGIEDGIASANRIREAARLKKKYTGPFGKSFGVKFIAVDFEVIGRKLPGPSHMPRDEYTELTKASFVTMDIGNNKIDNHLQTVSNHGYYKFKEMDEKMQNGWSTENTFMMKEELGVEWAKNHADATPSEVAAAWNELMEKEVKIAVMNGQPKYASSQSMMRDFADKLKQEIMRASNGGNNKVYIVSKNGMNFDFKLLAKWAPELYDKIKSTSIDIQNVMSLQNRRTRNETALGLNKLIMSLMGRLGATDPLDIDLPGNARKALEFFHQKGYLTQNKNEWRNLIGDLDSKGWLSKAHASPTVDNLFTQVLVEHQVKSVLSADPEYSPLYEDLDTLQWHLSSTQHVPGIDTSIALMQNMHGRAVPFVGVARAGMTSHGMIHKMIMSTIGLNNLMAFPFNKLSKQWDQLWRQSSVTFTDKSGFLDKSGNITDYKKYKARTNDPLTTRTALSAETWARKAGDMTAAMSHHVMARSLYLWNPSAGREGLVWANPEVFRGMSFHQMYNVSLNEGTFLDNPVLNNDLRNLADEIHTTAKNIALKGNQMTPTVEQYKQAADYVLRTRKEQGKSITIKPGQNFIASEGDMGGKVIRTQSPGEITNIVFDETSGTPKLYATLRTIASGQNMLEQPMVLRSLGTKATVVWNKYISQNYAYGQDVGVVANADFIEKKYPGSLKELAMRQVITRLGEQEDSSDYQTRRNAQEQLKKISEKLNAHWDSKEKRMIINDDIDSVKHRIKFDRIHNIKESEDALRYMGVANVDVDFINQMAKSAGMVWTDEMINVRNNIFGGEKNLQENVMLALKSDSEKLDQFYETNEEALRGLRKEDLKKIRDERDGMLKSWLLAKRGDAAIMVPIRTTNYGNPAKEVYQMGFDVVDRHVFSIAEGGHARRANFNLRSRSLNLLSLPGACISKDWIEYFRRNTRQYFEKTSNDIVKSLKFYNDTLYSTAASTKALTLKEIESLVTRKNETKKMLNSLRRSLTAGDVDAIEARIKQLTDFGDMLADGGEFYQRTLDELKSQLEKNKRVDAIETNHRLWKTLDEATYWANLAKQKGVWAINANDSGDLFEFDFQHIQRMAKNSEIDQVKRQNKKMITLLEDVFNRTQGKGIVQSLERDEAGNIIKAKLRTAILPADFNPANTVNMLNDYLGHVTFDNILKFDAFEAERYYQDTVKMLGKNSEATKNAKALRDSAVYKAMSSVFSMASDGQNWKAANEASVPGARLKHLGGDAILYQSYLLKQRGGFGSLSDFAGDDKAGSRATGNKLLDTILSSKGNVGFIRLSTFQKLGMESLEDGERVRVAQGLNQIFRDKRGLRFSKVVEHDGFATVAGAFSRDPTHASGIDAVRGINLMVINDDLADAVGVGHGGVAIQTVHGSPTGADNDGDEVVLMMRNYKTAQQMMNASKANDDVFKEAMDRPDMKKMFDEIGKTKIIGYQGDGNIITQDYYTDGPKKGQVRFKTVSGAEAKEMVVQQFSELKDLSTMVTTHSNKFITTEFVNNQVNHALYSAVAKNLIGVYTNVAFKTGMLLQLGAADKMTPADLATYMGNMKYGLVGLSQKIIDFAKHTQDIPRYVKAAKYLQNMGLGEDMEGKNALRHIMVEEGWKKFGMEDADQKFDDFVNTVGTLNKRARDDKDFGLKLNELLSSELGIKNTNIIDESLAYASRSFDEFLNYRHISSTVPTLEIPNPFEELKSSIKTKLSLTDVDVASFKKAGKIGAIGAGVFLAANFFNPMKLSNSSNPLDSYASLGENNIIGSDLDLPRQVPLEMVNSSFSKQAYIKLNKSNKREQGNILSSLFRNSFFMSEPLEYRSRSGSGLDYRNYTTSVGYFGNSNLERRFNEFNRS